MARPPSVPSRMLEHLSVDQRAVLKSRQGVRYHLQSG
jgi:hypothetical protein